MKRVMPSVAGLTVTMLAFVVTFVVRVKADDVWWHLGAGEWMLSHHAIPSTNLFSFSAPSTPWLPHEWLSEVIFAALFHASPWVLVAVATMLEVAAFALLAVLARGDGDSPLLSSVVTLLAAFLLLANFSIRPYLFGNLALLTTLVLVRREFRLRPVALFVLFVAWANLHGSFIFGLGVLGLELLFGPARRRRALELALGVGACVCTPHHVHGLLFPLVYLRRPAFLANIMEWQPVSLSTPLGWLLGVAVLVTVALLWLGRARRPEWKHLVLFAVFTLGAFLAVRNVALLGVAMVVVLARPLSAVGTVQRERVDFERSASLLAPLGLWSVVLVVSLLRAHAPLQTLSPDFHPDGLLAHLAQQPRARVFNSYNWGGALLQAGQQVFIDQRNDCYPEQVFTDYFTVHRVEDGWQAVLDRWNVGAVAWPAEGRLTEALRTSAGWVVEWEDSDAVLFVRRQ